MLNQPELNPNPKKTTARRGILFLRQKLTKLLPPMWYNNDLDTHHIIRDRIWFLRENRFLFFTRSGPVEITLRPTTVLASAIICMVGISVIFLSTIFASYSAIEVMRDETIQTAQASNTPSDNSAQRTDIIAPFGDEAAVLQRDISPQIVLSDLNDKINGKTATAPKPLPSRFSTQPQVNAPSLGELSNIAEANQLPPLPQIITGDGEQDANLANMLPVGTLAASKRKRDTAAGGTVNPNPDSDESIIDLALAITPAHQAPSVDTLTEQMPGQAVDQIAGGMNTDVPPLALPESNSAEYASAELRTKIVLSEQPLALPSPCYPGCLQNRTLHHPPRTTKPYHRPMVMIPPAARLMMALLSLPIMAGLARYCHRSVMPPAPKKCCYHLMAKLIISAKASASLVSRPIICRNTTPQTAIRKT